VFFRHSAAPVTLLFLLTGRVTVTNSIAIARNRHITQRLCPWNVTFARVLPAGSPYAARAVLSGKDARALAADILGMEDAAYRDAFRGSAMKRAKLAGLQRNAGVVLGDGG
jgi:epoxyqueuosine reductase